MPARPQRTARRPGFGLVPLAMLLAATVALAGQPAAKAPDPKSEKAASSPSETTVAQPDKTAEPKSRSDAGPAEQRAIWGKSMWDTFRRGGPLMYPILFCSLFGLAFAIERFVSLRQNAVAPKSLAAEVLSVIGKGGVGAGIELCGARPSALGRVLGAGLEFAGGSRGDMTAAMEEAGARELWHLERFAKPLSVIAGVSPLLGLLGTVWGMIMAFDVVAQKGALGDMRALAEGIAAALLTTFAGLSVAIPCFVLHHYFRSKSDRMICEIEETASHLVAQLQGASSHAHPAPAGGGRRAADDAAH